MLLVRFLYRTTCICSLTLGTLASAGQQQAASKSVSVAERNALLRRPGGLEILAKREGAFVIKSPNELFGDVNLQTLVKESSEIALVSIQSRTSRLLPGGDDIFTDYTFVPVEVFKGTLSKEPRFSAAGGKVTFENGTSAEIETIEWQSLQVGEQYILFLQNSGDKYRLTNGIEAAIAISSDGSKMTSLSASDPTRPHAVLKDIQKYNPDSFKSFLRATLRSTK